MTSLLQRVEQNIQTRQLLKRGQKILVAVSGGLDSMVLLHALDAFAKKGRWPITVAHFNHQLRGRASDADEKLVRKTAATLKLPFFAGRADVKQFARQSKLSIEMAARKLRHEFFSKIAREQKIPVVALAHHADDQVELFFLRALRGAGGEGLAGMKWRAPSPVDKKIVLVRPLLNLNKDELRKFARENKIRFREDATNFSSDFLRNRIRNELLPLLRKNYQPGLDKVILRLMEISSAESEFVSDTAERLCAGSNNFNHFPAAIQRRILQRQLAENKTAANFDLIESLRHSANQFVSVDANISVARNESGEIQLREALKVEFNARELVVNLVGRAGKVIFGGTKFVWKKSAIGNRQSAIQQEFFDAGKIGSRIILRHWRAGDRFQPIGLKSAAKLQDLFTNQKIPRERRRELIVAEAAEWGNFLG